MFYHVAFTFLPFCPSDFIMSFGVSTFPLPSVPLSSWKPHLSLLPFSLLLNESQHYIFTNVSKHLTALLIFILSRTTWVLLGLLQKKFTLLVQVTSKCYRLSHHHTCRNLSVSFAVVPSCHLSAFRPTTSHACLNSSHALSFQLSRLWVCTPWPPIKVHPNICVSENLIWSSNWQKTDSELGRGMGGKHTYSASVTERNVSVSSPCRETLFFSLVHLLLSAFPHCPSSRNPSQLPCPRSLSLSSGSS